MTFAPLLTVISTLLQEIPLSSTFLSLFHHIVFSYFSYSSTHCFTVWYSKDLGCGFSGSSNVGIDPHLIFLFTYSCQVCLISVHLTPLSYFNSQLPRSHSIGLLSYTEEGKVVMIFKIRFLLSLFFLLSACFETNMYVIYKYLRNVKVYISTYKYRVGCANLTLLQSLGGIRLQ